MSNGTQEVQVEVSWWTQPCSTREWQEFFPLLVAWDVSLPLFWAGLSASDRPDRGRAAGCLAALAAPTDGVLDLGRATEARALLKLWCRRAKAAEAKAQYPQEDRTDTA